MTNISPLRIAALEIVTLLESQWSENAWPAVSYLYAGAILQMREYPPCDKIELETFTSAGDHFHTEATSPLKANGILIKAAKEILDEDNDEKLSGMARSLVEILGHHVFSRITYLIDSDVEIAEGNVENSCINGTIANIKFRLIPSFLGGGFNYDQEPFKHRILNLLPEDGWSPQHTKILPRFVRVLTGNSIEKTKVRHLETIDPDANNLLAENYEDCGLTFASIPLPKEFLIDIKKIGKVADGDLFRVIEDNILNEPKRLACLSEYIETTIKKCSENNVSIAVIPELMSSPTVMELWAKSTKTKYPVLFVAGSWHTGEGDSFSNKLTVYSNSGNKLRKICTHEKFTPFTFKGYVEGNKRGNGFTYLITSLGVIVLGICRDWFFYVHSDGGAEAIKQITEVVPTVSIAPSMTTDTNDIVSNLDQLLRRERTCFIFCNSCGQTCRSVKRCCACDPEDKDNILKDLRSFVAAPKGYYVIEPLCEGKTENILKVPAVKAKCRNDKNNDNTVFARLKIDSREW